MKFYIFTIIIVAAATAIFFLSHQTKTQSENCFDPDEFEAIYNYTIWKDKTSKIGKVLVNKYRVEVSKEDKTLHFKDDKEDYTIFKVNQEKGIILLPVKQSKKLETKANQAYCALLERARLHPVSPQD